jgi:hypothetical protein
MDFPTGDRKEFDSIIKASGELSCESFFTRPLLRLLAPHFISRVMSSVSQFHCDKCGEEFPSLAELDYHKISKHTGQLSGS